MRDSGWTEGWTWTPGDPPGTGELRGALALGGQPVAVRLGAHFWGQLNAARDNAVLVCHHYTGTMRAASAQPDGTPGWWASLIGPGQAIDTERFFVVCLNSLCGVQVRDPEVVTTGPDTPHPDGEPWGERFPAWDMGDLHAAQWGLLRALELPRWHAVAGPSFGGMQALQWAARTPHLAPRVAAVVSSPRAGPVLRGVFGPLLRAAAAPGGPAGLHEALRLISFFGLGADGLEELFRHGDLEAHLSDRARCASLAHIRRIGRAVQTHDLGAVAAPEVLWAQWRAHGTALLSANVRGDLFFPAAEMRAFAGAAGAAGVNYTHLEYDSPLGHLGGLSDTAAFMGPLRDLLAAPVPPAALSPLEETAHD